MKTNCFCGSFYCVIISLIFLICVVNCESNAILPTHRIVETENGKVRGLLKTTWLKGVEYYSFKGIPYAKAPTGELRFKPPEPVQSWTPTIRDAFEHGKMCIQSSSPNQQSEDCLFLNIYVPADVKPEEKFAVICYLHGGGYGVGCGNDLYLGPDFLLEQRVIVVTLNYRLGVFGFMSFGTPEHSGNMGLKDQQFALKWVHSNIERFSGDNQRITMSGISAGGSSAHFQLFSAESRKYFRNIISMSGTVDDYWALSMKSDDLDLAHQIAKDLGKPKQTLDELIAFLKTVPANSMANYFDVTRYRQRLFQSNLSPVIERKDAVRPFIVDLPSKLYNLSEINVDAMFSLSQSEFISFYSKSSEQLKNFSDLNTNFTLKLPFRGINLPVESSTHKNIMTKIRQFYFGNATIDEKALMQSMAMLSDINLAYGIDKSARMHATKTKSKTFYYRFSVDSKLNLMKRIMADGGDLPGAGHGDNECYLFRCSFLQSAYDEILQNKDDEQSKISLRTIEDLTKLFANFAKYGEPTHSGDPVAGFLPIKNDQVNFLDVTNDGLKPGVNPNQAANKLWEEIEQEVMTEA